MTPFNVRICYVFMTQMCLSFRCRWVAVFILFSHKERPPHTVNGYFSPFVLQQFVSLDCVHPCPHVHLHAGPYLSMRDSFNIPFTIHSALNVVYINYGLHVTNPCKHDQYIGSTYIHIISNEISIYFGFKIANNLYLYCN